METRMLNVKINGRDYQVSEGTTILKAARDYADVDVPTLCYLEGISEEGGCGMCMVEVKGARTLQRSCITRIAEGMEITTDSERVSGARKTNLELALAHHPLDCMTCDADGDCELQDLAYRFGIKKSQFLKEREAFETLKETAWDSNPFIQLDPQKCILCSRCVEACENQAIVEAIGIAMRGDNSVVATPFGLPLEQTDCQFCGACVQACPTGALLEKPRIGKGKVPQFQKTDTVCAYCGTGCNVTLYRNAKNELLMARGKEDSIVNKGRLCVKGRYGHEYVNSKERLTKPLVKEDGKFRETSWEEALDFTARRLREVRDKYGPASIGVLGSSRCTNEDNYVVQKLARAVLGTNSVDNCARLCHASTIAGLGKAFGAAAATNPIEDIKNADVMFVIGSNMTETHPVIAQFVKENQKKGAKLIVCDPRRTDLAKIADVYIQHTPGTDVALLNGIMNVIVSKGLVNRQFVEEHTEGYEAFVNVVSKYDPETVAKIAGIDRDLIEKAAVTYAEAQNATIFYTMGITQHSVGTDNVLSVANLALVTGHIGREGNGVNPLRGQSNVQGACDMGDMPNVFPGYQKIDDDAAREKFEKAWGVKLSSEPGYPVTEFGELALEGKLKAVYAMGENPMMTEPDITHVKEGFEKLEFFAVQDIFLSESAELADVVFPSAAAYEKEGTFTNTERRVQLLRPAREKPEGTRFDWETVCEIATRFGYPMHYGSASEIMDEIASLTPSYGGIHHFRLEKEGIQWPCPNNDHAGTKILHSGGVFGSRPSKKGLLSPVEFLQAKELPDEEYPFLLTTGRILFHYHSGNETRRVKSLDAFVPRNYVEIGKEDADTLGIKNGEMVRVSSRRGAIELEARISDKPKKGLVFISFHFREANANVLTNPALDPVSKIPEFKVCACKIERI
jgi:formate dehydrogenase alpha subunit